MIYFNILSLKFQQVWAEPLFVLSHALNSTRLTSSRLYCDYGGRKASDAYQEDTTWLNLAVCPWQLPPSSTRSPAARHARYFSSRVHRRFGEGVRTLPHSRFVIPEPSPGHAMFIRLPQTAMQSVAPDERECCVREGEQTVRTASARVVLNHIKFSNLSGLEIGRSLIFQSWVVSQCEDYWCGVT